MERDNDFLVRAMSNLFLATIRSCMELQDEMENIESADEDTRHNPKYLANLRRKNTDAHLASELLAEWLRSNGTNPEGFSRNNPRGFRFERTIFDTHGMCAVAAFCFNLESKIAFLQKINPVRDSILEDWEG